MTSRRRATTMAVVAGALLGSGLHAAAQAPAPLEAADAGAPVVFAAAPANAAATDSRLRLDKDSRPTLELPFGEIQFRGRLSSTVQTPPHDRGSGSDAAWQTRRLQIEGRLFKKVEFEVSREFGDADDPERDAFANVRVSRAFEVRAGEFKMPFGRDALTSGANLDFVRRSLAGRLLAPGRDVGVMAHGRLAGRRLTYQAGLFHGDGDNARTSQTRGADRGIAGRLIVTPFAATAHPALAGLQVGAAVVTSDLDDQLGLRGRTVFGEGVFFDRVFVNGRRLRQGFEAAWALGPVSLAWEHITVVDQRAGMGAGGEALPSVQATGWYLAGTWTITGERKQGRVEPHRSLFGDGYGALEAVARVERLGFDAAFDPALPADPLALLPAANADRVTTIGLNWYLNRFLKITGNAVFESVGDPQRSPAPGHDGHFPTAVVQFQFAL